jgi:hypothetical protein
LRPCHGRNQEKRPEYQGGRQSRPNAMPFRGDSLHDPPTQYAVKVCVPGQNPETAPRLCANITAESESAMAAKTIGLSPAAADKLGWNSKCDDRRSA